MTINVNVLRPSIQPLRRIILIKRVRMSRLFLIQGRAEIAPLLVQRMPLSILWKQGILLVANGLKVYEDICRISARMIVNKASLKNNKEVLPFICKIESLVGNEEVSSE